jgi:hypothetical protein
MYRRALAIQGGVAGSVVAVSLAPMGAPLRNAALFAACGVAFGRQRRKR